MSFAPMNCRCGLFRSTWSTHRCDESRAGGIRIADAMNPPARYARMAVVLHWIAAVLIIVLLATGWYMVGTQKNTPERAFVFNLHKSLGITTAFVIVTLIALRIRHAAPALPTTMPRWERMAAVFNHRLC